MAFIIPLALPLIEMGVEAFVKGAAHEVGKETVQSEFQNKSTSAGLKTKNQSQAHRGPYKSPIYRKHKQRSKSSRGHRQPHTSKRKPSRYR